MLSETSNCGLWLAVKVVTLCGALYYVIMVCCINWHCLLSESYQGHPVNIYRTVLELWHTNIFSVWLSIILLLSYCCCTVLLSAVGHITLHISCLDEHVIQESSIINILHLTFHKHLQYSIYISHIWEKLLPSECPQQKKYFDFFSFLSLLLSAPFLPSSYAKKPYKFERKDSESIFPLSSFFPLISYWCYYSLLPKINFNFM